MSIGMVSEDPCKGESEEEVYCEFQQQDSTVEMDLDSSSMEESFKQELAFATGTWPDDDVDVSMMNEANDEDLLEQLIEVSIRKIHQLQSFHRKDERRRVLIVNMLHSLLMKKIDILKEEGGLAGEDSALLNNLLQEKICGLGLGRSVRIWVDAPKKPGQLPTLQLPVKGMKRDKGGSSRKAEDADGGSNSENSPAPSGRDTASY